MIAPYITGGKYSGQKLKTPGDNEKTFRPMRSRIREALFHSMGDQLEGETALDLFAGSGALGLEVLSRGGTFSTFVDISDQAITCIRHNIQKLHGEEQTQVIQTDTFELQKSNLNQEKGFHNLFVTPPYDYYQSPHTRRNLVQLLQQSVREEWVHPQGRIVVESRSGEGLGHMPFPTRTRTQKRYGITEIQIIQLEPHS